MMWSSVWHFLFLNQTSHSKVISPPLSKNRPNFLVQLTPTFMKGFQWNFQILFTMMWSSVWHFLFLNRTSRTSVCPSAFYCRANSSYIYEGISMELLHTLLPGIKLAQKFREKWLLPRRKIGRIFMTPERGQNYDQNNFTYPYFYVQYLSSWISSSCFKWNKRDCQSKTSSGLHISIFFFFFFPFSMLFFMALFYNLILVAYILILYSLKRHNCLHTTCMSSVIGCFCWCILATWICTVDSGTPAYRAVSFARLILLVPIKATLRNLFDKFLTRQTRLLCISPLAFAVQPSFWLRPFNQFAIDILSTESYSEMKRMTSDAH